MTKYKVSILKRAILSDFVNKLKTIYFSALKKGRFIECKKKLLYT